MSFHAQFKRKRGICETRWGKPSYTSDWRRSTKAIRQRTSPAQEPLTQNSASVYLSTLTIPPARVQPRGNSRYVVKQLCFIGCIYQHIRTHFSLSKILHTLQCNIPVFPLKTLVCFYIVEVRGVNLVELRTSAYNCLWGITATLSIEVWRENFERHTLSKETYVYGFLSTCFLKRTSVCIGTTLYVIITGVHVRDRHGYAHSQTFVISIGMTA